MNITNIKSVPEYASHAVAASTGTFDTSSDFAQQALSPIEYNPPKARIGKGRPFKESQKWTAQGDIATCIVEPGVVAVVDLADLPIVDGHRWYINQRGKNSYAETGQAFLMHRMVAGLEKGDGKRIDHRNCDALNNRRSNLRITDQSNNAANSRKHKKTKSQYKGVRIRQGKYISAEITKRIEGVKTKFNLGPFPTEELAAHAYDQKAVELFGEFARLNFPLPAVEQGKAA